MPSSHKWERSLNPDEPTIQVEMKAGSLLVWDGALYAGGANKTSNETDVPLIEFQCVLVETARKSLSGVPRSVISEMPDLLQRLLCYNRVNHFVVA